MSAGESQQGQPVRDALGDPLPAGAVARLGSMRLWHAQVTAVNFSVDGKELTTLGVCPDSAGSFVSCIRWWNAVNGRLLREVCFPDHPLTAWAASPDGKQLALGIDGHDGRRRITLWDVAKGKEIDSPLMEHVWPIAFLKYLPDGKTLVSRDDGNKSFHFWDLATRKEVKRAKVILPGKKHYTQNASSLSNDGRRSAWYAKTYGTNADGEPRSVDGELIQVVEDGGKILWRKEGPFQGNIPVAISPDGKLLAWDSDGNSPQITDIASHKTLAVFPLGSGVSETLSFSPDSKILASTMIEQAGKFRAAFWDVAKRRELCSILVSDDYRYGKTLLSFPADGKTVAITGDRRTRVYDVATGKERLHLPIPHRLSISKLFFSSDGNSLFSRDEEVVCRWTTEAKGHVGFRQSPQVRRQAELIQPLVDKRLMRGYGGEFYSPDLTLAINEEKDIFDLVQSPPRRICRLQLDKGGAYWTEGFSPDNQTVVLIRHERETDKRIAFEVFEVRSGKRLGCWRLSGEMNSTFSPDSHFFAWQERKQGQIIVGDSRAGKIVKTLTTDLAHKPHRPWPRGALSSVAFADPNQCRWGFDQLAINPDNRRLAAAWNSNLSALVGPGQVLGQVEEKEPTTLYVWSIGRGKEMARIAFRKPKDKMPQITCLTFLRDGRTLAAGYLNDPAVHLIEIASGQERAALRGHQAVVRSLTLSPDVRYLFSGSDDTTILVWDLDALPGALPPPHKTPLSAKELAQLWEDLASTKAAVAFQAIGMLRHSPAQAQTLLRQRLQPVISVKPERIQRWIAELDSSDFEGRERAMKELEHLGELAEEPLRRALTQRPSLEVRLRLQRLLEIVTAFSLAPEQLRQVRGVELLEAIGDAESRQHLKRLAGGAGAARMTHEASESLLRLSASHEWPGADKLESKRGG